MQSNYQISKKLKADFLGPPFTIAKVIQGVYIAKWKPKKLFTFIVVLARFEDLEGAEFKKVGFAKENNPLTNVFVFFKSK